jgi:hypothetical protein
LTLVERLFSVVGGGAILNIGRGEQKVVPLYEYVSRQSVPARVPAAKGKGKRCLSPLLCHHQDSLDQKPFQNLRTYSLEETQGPLVIDNKFHHFTKALERFPISGRRRLGLETDFGNDQWLSSNGSQSFGEATQD